MFFLNLISVLRLNIIEFQCVESCFFYKPLVEFDCLVLLLSIRYEDAKHE